MSGLAALSLALASFVGGTPQAHTIAMPEGMSPEDEAFGDVNGDGRRDLVIARHAGKKPFARSLAVYFGTDDATRFHAAPDLELDVTPDTSAFAVGDVTSDPGDEIVLFSAGGVFVWKPRAKEEERFAKLVSASYLWQLGDPETVFAARDSLIDLDGDKLPDLVIPEPGGWRIALQRRDAKGASDFSTVYVLRAPPEPAADLSYMSLDRGEPKFRGNADPDALRISFGMDSGTSDDLDLPTPLVSVVERSPAPIAVDFDRDGKLDIVAQGTRRLLVWKQAAGGSFTPSPTSSYALPVIADRERRLDASYSAKAVDLDVDGRMDCAIFASDKRSDDVRTQVLIFVQGQSRGDAAQTADSPLFGARGIPSQLLVIAGFVVSSSFERVDGDAYPDLVVRSVRPDLIDQLRSISSETVDADLYVYLNKKGVLSKKPDLSYRYPVRLREFDPAATFVNDGGGSLAELVLRSEPEKLRVLALRPTHDGLEVIEKPIAEYALDPASRLDLARPRIGATELSIREPHALIEVSWK